MRLKLFHIVYKGGKLPILNEKLDLDDEIEKGDYKEISNGDTSIDFNFLEELYNTTDFHLSNKFNVDDYYKQFLVITNSQYKVLGFIRI